MDLQLGGKRLICMARPDSNMKMLLGGEYTEILPKTRLVYTESMADQHRNLLATNDESPVTSVITVILESIDGGTKMHLTHAGLGVNQEGASAGWEQSIDKMAEQIANVLKS
jgi:uncharacterized protein YndB with AHSA1/START domain